MTANEACVCDLILMQRDDSYKIITDVRVSGGVVEFVGGVGTHILWDLQTLFNFRYFLFVKWKLRSPTADDFS